MSTRASYGGRVPAAAGGGVVSLVDPESPAARAGIADGDVLVSVDGQPLRDIIDWQWLSDGSVIEVALRHGSTTRDEMLSRSPGEGWGVEFADAVFDGVRTCRNRCAFCFMTQLPRGLRRALYLRDDDYRLSFLQGNFVTLTNLSDSDVERIGDQQLSPLYVSVHSVDPAVRAELVCAREDRALERFDELLDAGIEMHVQIVLVPGVNDGEQLDRTLTWLAEREGVLSVGIVPLGFTAHQQRFESSFAGPAAAAVIAQVEPWQVAFRERDALTWVYLADEFYLQAAAAIPPAEYYDGFPQYENGIGLVRDWIDAVLEVHDELAAAGAAARVSSAFVSGTLFAPVLSATLADLPQGAHREILAVANRFFGGNVSVTGLLTASDLVPAISASEAQVVFVPDVVANADGMLLDDVRADELSARTGKDVRLISCDACGLLAALRGLAADLPDSHKE